MDGQVRYKGHDLFRRGEKFYINKVYEYTEPNCIYHSHDFIEINYVFAGQGFQRIGEKTYRAVKGDVFVINNGKGHVFYRTDPDGELIIYNIIFNPDFLDTSLIHGDDFTALFFSYLFQNDFSLDTVFENIRLDSEELEGADRLVNRMYQEYSQRREGYYSILRAYLIELIVQLMRAMHKRTRADPNRQKDYLVRKAVAYLQDNYTGNVNLQKLSSNLFINKNYLCKLFKAFTGMTTSEYIQQLRIDRACVLLQNSNAKILDVAYAVGFKDYKFFNVVFKRIKGMGAREYRNAYATGTNTVLPEK